MYTNADLEDLMGRILKRGMRIDTTKGGGFVHTIHKANPDAPRAPVKFDLCTREVRPEARMTQDDIDFIGYLLYGYLKKHRVHVPAIMSVPHAGEQLARSLKEAAAQDGLDIPHVRLSKIGEDAERRIGPVVDNDGYYSGPVWMIDDVVRKGVSKDEADAVAVQAGYTVTDIMVVMDYGQGAATHFAMRGKTLHSLLILESLLAYGHRLGEINTYQHMLIREHLEKTRILAA